MEDESKVSPEIQSESSEKKSSKKLIFIIASFAIVAVLIFFVFLLLRATSKSPSNYKNSSNPIKVEEVTEPKLRDVQSEASGYISSQRLSTGYYNYYSHLDQLCKGLDPKNCQFTPTENKKLLTVSWTSLAHYSDYKVSNISAHLSEATRDMNKLIETCATQKSKCNAVLVQAAILYKETKDPKILQFLTEEATLVAASAQSDDLMIRGIEARELALAYELTNNPKFLSASKLKLEGAQKMLSQKITEDLAPKKRFPREACWVALAQIELGRVEAKSQDITNAVAFLDQYKLLENPDSLYNPIVFQPCIESYYNAGNALKSDSYVSYAGKLLDIFLANYLDSKSDKILFGEGGTATFPRTVKDTIANSIALPDSAYTNYLLYLKFLSTK